jgi:hypothetical protein
VCPVRQTYHKEGDDMRRTWVFAITVIFCVAAYAWSITCSSHCYTKNKGTGQQLYDCPNGPNPCQREIWYNEEECGAKHLNFNDACYRTMTCDYDLEGRTRETHQSTAGSSGWYIDFSGTISLSPDGSASTGCTWYNSGQCICSTTGPWVNVCGAGKCQGDDTPCTCSDCTYPLQSCKSAPGDCP